MWFYYRIAVCKLSQVGDGNTSAIIIFVWSTLTLALIRMDPYRIFTNHHHHHHHHHHHLVVLRQVHSHFQSEFLSESEPVLPLSISNILSFPKVHPLAADVFFLVFPCILPATFPSPAHFRRKLLRKMWPVELALLLFMVWSIFLSILVLCNSSSFFTRSVQL